MQLWFSYCRGPPGGGGGRDSGRGGGRGDGGGGRGGAPGGRGDMGGLSGMLLSMYVCMHDLFVYISLTCTSFCFAFNCIYMWS